MERVKEYIKLIILGSYGSALILPVIFVIVFIVLSFPIVFIYSIITGSNLYDMFSNIFSIHFEALEMLLKYYVVLFSMLLFANAIVFFLIYDIIKIFIILFE